jgi:FtsH-binding integral membrane protein
MAYVSNRQNSLNVIVDLVFALFPLVIIRNLQIERKVRLGIYLLLTCGLLASVCSVGRVVASDLTVEDITCKFQRLL